MAGFGIQVIVAVYSVVEVTLVSGAAPVTGTVTPLITVADTTDIPDPIAGNTAVIVPEFAGFVVVAPATLNWFAVIPVSVYPVLGVNRMVAV